METLVKKKILNNALTGVASATIIIRNGNGSVADSAPFSKGQATASDVRVLLPLLQ
jgi:hypothetical protein